MFLSKKQKVLSVVVFCIYLFLLTWLILFKLSTDISEIKMLNMRSINLIPFKESVIVNNSLDLSEIIYNILAFVPLGVYLCIFKPDWSKTVMILSAFSLSFLYELLQYLFAIGASDITDLIGNTLGALLGIGLYLIFQKLFKKKAISIVNGIGLAIEIIAFVLLILLKLANN